MNSYELSRNWFDFCFENPEKIKPNHTAVYFFCIEHCNRLGWKKKFGFPSTMVMEAIGIKSYNTYINTFNELVEWGFIEVIERSKNQYSANIVALSNFNKATDKALDKALIKHTTKQSESTVQSTIQSIDSINKQETIKQNNNKQLNKELFNEAKKKFFDFYKNKTGEDYYFTAKDAGNLKQLIKKIEFKLKEKNVPQKKEKVVESLEIILNRIQDKWILDNLSISIVNSKFNEIITQAKNGNTKESTEDRLRRIYKS